MREVLGYTCGGCDALFRSTGLARIHEAGCQSFRDVSATQERIRRRRKELILSCKHPRLYHEPLKGAIGRLLGSACPDCGFTGIRCGMTLRSLFGCIANLASPREAREVRGFECDGCGAIFNNSDDANGHEAECIQAVSVAAKRERVRRSRIELQSECTHPNATSTPIPDMVGENFHVSCPDCGLENNEYDMTR